MYSKAEGIVCAKASGQERKDHGCDLLNMCHIAKEKFNILSSEPSLRKFLV